MKLRYEPLLRVQRDLCMVPRGGERFHEYLRVMTSAEGEALALPRVDSNPMANTQGHLLDRLDALLALDAEGVAAAATAEAEAGLAVEPGDYAVTMVVYDDWADGGRSPNRYAAEMIARFRQKAYYTHGWVVAVLWASERYTPERVRQEVVAASLRVAYVQRHGYAHSLREILDQEGCALRGAGVSTPALAAEDLAYTRGVLEPYLDHTDAPSLLPALFGDRAAHELGYPPLGLSEGAGLALAIADGQRQ